MAALTITEAQLEAAHDDATAAFKNTGTGYTAAHTMQLSSKDEYGEAFSGLFDFAVGDTDNKILSGQLIQKMLHVAFVISFWIANRIGYDAVMKGKPINGMGLSW